MTSSTPTSVSSVATASSVTELQSALAALNSHDSTVTTRLKTHLSTQTSLTHTLSRLDLIRAHLGTQVVSARSLSTTTLSPAATTANRVSSAVKRLDLEQSRVRATLAVVDQVSELKTCVIGVMNAMGAAQDWETAANFLHRASKIPDEIVAGDFAAEMVASAETPDPPKVTLEMAAEGLCKLFLARFEKAVNEKDGEGITRFFKLFPLIGRGDTGLDVYGRYVCTGVAGRAREVMNQDQKGDFFFAGAITGLFEHIATIVEQHGKLVELHYGEGKMVKVVERLQVEADMQAGIIIDTFSDEKALERKLTDIKSYAYGFLVQSFLAGTKQARTGSPAVVVDAEEETIDIKTVDLLLSEIGVMLSRWSMYCRFLGRKCQPASNSPDALLSLPSVISNSLLLPKIINRLITPFNVMTTFFIRRSIEKAFQLDEFPDFTHSQPPYISSAVDDVMYIVQKLLSRALETSQCNLTLTVLSTVSRVLSTDFIGMIQRQMRDTRPSSSNSTFSPTELSRFLVLINNLEIAASYVHRIVASQEEEKVRELFPFEKEADTVLSAMRGMATSFESKTGEIIADASTVVFNQVIKPRLRPLLADTWRDVDYLVALSTSSEDPEPDGDLVRARFESGWNSMMAPVNKVLTERPMSRILNTTAGYLSKLLEKKIWGFEGRVSELGAVRMERDIQGVVGVVTKGRYEMRETFERCLQIVFVVGMEEGEEAGVEWKIDAEERRRALGMVVRD
ncbi:COG4 transport protein-domain-containing protein [Pyronema omphalodes]|nr:COG4 transport protein-domain-containing protein [Pyronema omphalodes]